MSDRRLLCDVIVNCSSRGDDDDDDNARANDINLQENIWLNYMAQLYGSIIWLNYMAQS